MDLKATSILEPYHSWRLPFSQSLERALRGKVEHVYQHDAESFIWVLTWVCLRYDKGGDLVSQSKRNSRPLEDWLKVDARQCHKEKNSFLTSGRKVTKPSSSHKDSWEGAQCCLDVIVNFYGKRHEPVLDVDVVFTTWLEEPLRSF